MKSVGASVSRPHSSALTFSGDMKMVASSDIAVTPARRRAVRVDTLMSLFLVMLSLEMSLLLVLRGWMADNDDEEDDDDNDDVAEIIADCCPAMENAAALPTSAAQRRMNPMTAMVFVANWYRLLGI